MYKCFTDWVGYSVLYVTVITLYKVLRCLVWSIVWVRVNPGWLFVSLSLWAVYLISVKCDYLIFCNLDIVGQCLSILKDLKLKSVQWWPISPTWNPPVHSSSYQDLSVISEVYHKVEDMVKWIFNLIAVFCGARYRIQRNLIPCSMIIYLVKNSASLILDQKY